ncbi:MAG: hypothetical protein ACRDK5_11085 [Solirubrobacterales bacterium]
MPPVAADQVARSFLSRSLCCAVEVCLPTEAGAGVVSWRWEPSLVVLRDGEVGEVVEAVAETIRAHPNRDVRIAGYDPSRLRRVASPPPFVCFQAGARGPQPQEPTTSLAPV